MARLTKDEWKEVRADYEVNGLSYSELSLKYQIGKTTVADKVKKGKWIKGLTEPLLEKKVKAVKELRKINDETELLSARNREEFGRAFDFRMRMEDEQAETGYVAAKINRTAVRKLEKRMDNPDTSVAEEAIIIDKVATIAGTYQKLQKKEASTVINNSQTSNTMNVTLEEEKQELMNILNAYD